MSDQQPSQDQQDPLVPAELNITTIGEQSRIFADWLRAKVRYADASDRTIVGVPAGCALRIASLLEHGAEQEAV